MKILICELIKTIKKFKIVGIETLWNRTIIFKDDNEYISLDFPYIYMDETKPCNIFTTFTTKKNIFDMSYNEEQEQIQQLYQLIDLHGKTHVKSIDKAKVKIIIDFWFKQMCNSSIIKSVYKFLDKGIIGISLTYEFILYYGQNKKRINCLGLPNIIRRFKKYMFNVYHYNISSFDVLDYLKKLSGFENPPKLLGKFDVRHELFVEIFQPFEEKGPTITKSLSKKCKIISTFFTFETAIDIIELISTDPYPQVNKSETWGLHIFGHFLHTPCNLRFTKDGIEQNPIILFEYMSSFNKETQIQLFPKELRYYISKRLSKSDLFICEDVKRMNEFIMKLEVPPLVKSRFPNGSLFQVSYVSICDHLNFRWAQDMLKFFVRAQLLYILRYNLCWIYRNCIPQFIKLTFTNMYIPLINKINWSESDKVYLEDELKKIY